MGTTPISDVGEGVQPSLQCCFKTQRQLPCQWLSLAAKLKGLGFRRQPWVKNEDVPVKHASLTRDVRAPRNKNTKRSTENSGELIFCSLYTAGIIKLKGLPRMALFPPELTENQWNFAHGGSEG
jgi:hypothetical protein